MPRYYILEGKIVAETKIFISSIITDYLDRRDAAEEAINRINQSLNLNFKPIRIEPSKYPSVDKPSRQLCLEKVTESDIYLGIFPKDRYGWDDSPTGVSPTEEEYDRAKKCKKIILIFIESSERSDEKQEIFLKKVGDYIDGQFRNVFKEGNLDELKLKIYDALIMVQRDHLKFILPDYYKSIVTQFKYFDRPWNTDTACSQVNNIVQLDLIDETKDKTKTESIAKDDRDICGDQSISAHFTIQDAISKYQRILVAGDPGAGKSAILRWTAYTLAKQGLSSEESEKNLIPIFIELKWYKNKLLDLIVRFFMDNGIVCDNELVIRWLRSGNFLLIFDGFDEVVNVENCLKDIKEILSYSSKNKCVVSSRKNMIPPSFEEMNFCSIMIKPLSNIQMEHFIENYLGKEAVNNFLKELKGLNFLQEGQNPLILRLILLEYQNRLNIPHHLMSGDLNKGILFKNVIEHNYLGRWEKNKFSGAKEKSVRKSDQYLCLSKMAFHMVSTSNSVTIDEKEVLDIFRYTLKNGRMDYEALIDECLRDLFNSKILVQNGSDIGFWYKSFRDYFAALELVNIYSKGAKIITKKYSTELWEDPILFFIGLIENPSQYINSLIRPYWVYFFKCRFEFPFHLSLAAKCIAHNKKIEGDIQQKVIDLLEKILCFGKYIFLPQCYVFPYHKAISALGDTRSEKAIPVLIKIIDGDIDLFYYDRENTPKFGLEALKKIPSPKVEQLLLQRSFNGNSDRKFFNEIITTLGEIFSTETEKKLVQILSNRQNSVADRSRAIRILRGGGLLHDQNRRYLDVTISTFVDIALTDEELSGFAAFFLRHYSGDYRDILIVQPLIDALSGKFDPIARKNAADALMFQFTKESRKALINALDDKIPEVRCQAAHSLMSNRPKTECEEDVAATKLLAHFNDQDIYVKLTMIRTYGYIRKHPQDDEISSLIKFLEDDEPLVRDYTAFSLGIMKAQTAIEFLKNRVCREEYEVPWSTAIWAILQIDPSYTGTIKANRWECRLISDLDSEDLNVVIHTLRILRNIGTEYSLKFIEQRKEKFSNSERYEIQDHELKDKLSAALYYTIYDIKERIDIA